MDGSTGRKYRTSWKSDCRGHRAELLPHRSGELSLPKLRSLGWTRRCECSRRRLVDGRRRWVAKGVFEIVQRPTLHHSAAAAAATTTHCWVVRVATRSASSVVRAPLPGASMAARRIQSCFPGCALETPHSLHASAPASQHALYCASVAGCLSPRARRRILLQCPHGGAAGCACVELVVALGNQRVGWKSLVDLHSAPLSTAFGSGALRATRAPAPPLASEHSGKSTRPSQTDAAAQQSSDMWSISGKDCC